MKKLLSKAKTHFSSSNKVRLFDWSLRLVNFARAIEWVLNKF